MAQPQATHVTQMRTEPITVSSGTILYHTSDIERANRHKRSNRKRKTKSEDGWTQQGWSHGCGPGSMLITKEKEKKRIYQMKR